MNLNKIFEIKTKILRTNDIWIKHELFIVFNSLMPERKQEMWYSHHYQEFPRCKRCGIIFYQEISNAHPSNKEPSLCEECYVDVLPETLSKVQNLKLFNDSTFHSNSIDIPSRHTK